MNRDRIATLVREVVAANPLPAKLDDLDRHTLAQVRRRATEQGVTPEAYLAEAVAAETGEASAHAEAAEIVATIRRTRSGVV